MRRKPTFEDRFETLVAEATPEQLRRMVDLAGFALRRESRKLPLAAPLPADALPAKRRAFANDQILPPGGVIK
jgi:hypothetical protein